MSVSSVGIHLREAMGRRALPRRVIDGAVAKGPGEELGSRADGGSRIRVLNLGLNLSKNQAHGAAAERGTVG